MAEQKLNWLVAGITVFKHEWITVNDEKKKKAIEWERSLCGIYPTYKEADFIMNKIIQGYRKECHKKGIKPITYFYTEETSRDVTTIKVKKYLEQLRGVRNHG